MSSRTLSRDNKTEKRKYSRSPVEHRYSEGVSRGHKIQVCNAMQCNALSITEAGRRPVFPACSKN